MPLIKGAGLVWGISGGLTAQASGAPLTQSQNWSINSDSKEFKDGNGETKAVVFFNENYEMTMDVIPSGTTITLSKAENIFPVVGTKITIVDSDDAEIAGDYLFMSGDKKKSTDAEVMMTFKLKRWVTNDVTSTIS